MEARAASATGAAVRKRRRRPPKKNPNAPTVRPSVLADPGDAGPRETLRQPKRKARNNKKYLKVLPTGMTAATAQTWRANNSMPPLARDLGTYHTYEGVFDGHGVQVRGEPDLFWLHYQGCFGKANLSKSEPLHHRVVRDLAAGVTERATVEEKRVERKQRRVERNERRKQQKQQRQRDEAATRRRGHQEKEQQQQPSGEGEEEEEGEEKMSQEEGRSTGGREEEKEGAGNEEKEHEAEEGPEEFEGVQDELGSLETNPEGVGGGKDNEAQRDVGEKADTSNSAPTTATDRVVTRADAVYHEDDAGGDGGADLTGKEVAGEQREPPAQGQPREQLLLSDRAAGAGTAVVGEELPSKRAKRDSEGATRSPPHMRWTEVAATDVPPELRGRTVVEATKEVLQLSLVEAFFLKHGLGCLRIVDERGRDMSTLECWRSFRAAQPSFVQRYVVYHHLRSSGWIPKSGLKFAVDFLAYRQGPAYYHSSFSVCVKTAWEDTLEPWAPDTRQLPWHSLLNLVRMSNQAGKEPVMCHVLRPRHVTDGDLDHPDCIAHMRVLQVLPRRWVPERTRASAPA